MTAARSRIRIEPMNLTWAEVAEAVFRRSESWLRANIRTLTAEKGFPAPDARMEGLFNRAAIEAWVNGPYGGPMSISRTIEADLLAEAARGA